MASLGRALMPRTAQALGEGRPWYSPRVGLASIADQASLPGRAYVSLGRPQGEGYLDAVARTSPRMDLAGYQGEGDEMAESILRDPTLPLGVGLGRLLSGSGRLIRGLVGGAGEAVLSAGSQYADGGQVSPLGMAMAAGLGGASAIAPAGRAPRASMISPEERAANFKNWFGDSKVVDKAGNPLVVYHGGGKAIDDFSPGPKRGLLGSAYFTDDPNVALRYAISGGIDYSKSMTDLLRLKKKHLPERTPTITKTHVSIRRPFDITDRSAVKDVFSAFTPQEIDKMTQGVWIGDHLDQMYQNGDINTWREFLDAVSDDPEFLRGPTGSNDDLAVGNSPAHNFLMTTGMYDEFMKRKGYDGVIYYDSEAGGRTFVPINPTQIKSATGNRGTFDPNDPNITHFNAPTARSAAPTMAQGLGRRVTSGAIGASLRKYLQDDRPQGDTPYTRAR